MVMVKKLVFIFLAALLAVSGAVLIGRRAVSASSLSEAGGISYASLPDEAALYLNDMAFVRDTVTLPAEPVRVLLPPGT
jgi:hypothetical protein